MRAEDQYALDKSLRDVLRCARRLNRCSDTEAYTATLKLVLTLRKLGAKDED